MSVSLLYSGIDFVVDTEFQAVHIQSPVMDAMFFILAFFYIFHLLVAFPCSANLFRYPLKVDSCISDSMINIKYGIILLSKGLILLSVPVTMDALQPHISLSAECIILSVLSVFGIMVFRFIAFFILTIVTARSSFYELVKYTSDCQIVAFTLPYVSVLILAYSLNLYPVVFLVLLPVFYIIHIIRMIKVFCVASFSFFDIFLYLCIFDLLPLVIAISSIFKFLG